MWYQVFAKIGIGQWFRITTGVIQFSGGILFLFPGACRVGGAMLAATMVGAIIAQLTVLGNPIVIFHSRRAACRCGARRAARSNARLDHRDARTSQSDARAMTYVPPP